ncbi:hypothetical protein EGW08_004694, partial [Elysia chlorotica]
MRAAPLGTCLVFVYTLTMASAYEIKHLKDSMENSVHYSWSGKQAVRKLFTCKICGPPNLVLLWHKTCLENGARRVNVKWNNDSSINKRRILNAKAQCNRTIGGTDFSYITSIYMDRLPTRFSHCFITCCGIAESSLTNKSLSDPIPADFVRGQSDPKSTAFWNRFFKETEERTNGDWDTFELLGGECKRVSTDIIGKILLVTALVG